MNMVALFGAIAATALVVGILAWVLGVVLFAEHISKPVPVKEKAKRKRGH